MKKYTTPHGVLYQGDCLTVMGKILAEDSVDLIISSPPYEDARSYGELEFNLKGQDWVDWMVQVYAASVRVCKGLTAYVVGHGKGGCRRWSATPALLTADLHRGGFNLRNPPLYARNGVSGSGQNDWLRADYEWIICCTKEPKELPWHDIASVGHKPICKPGGATSHRLVNGQRVDRGRPVLVDIANPGNIIKCGSVGGGNIGSKLAHENEAPFPEQISDFFIRAFCPPGGIVLDPFCGSGTTASMAIQNGRKFICCDLRESQIKLTLKRIKEAEARKGFGF